MVYKCILIDVLSRGSISYSYAKNAVVVVMQKFVFIEQNIITQMCKYVSSTVKPCLFKAQWSNNYD